MKRWEPTEVNGDLPGGSAAEHDPMLDVPRTNAIARGDADLEAGEVDQPQCRICLETNGRDYIAPCRCKGSSKYVHRTCLDRWRASKEGFAFAHCTTCRTPYHLRVHTPPDQHWRTLKFRFFVTRDVLVVTAVVQLVIFLLGYGVYSIDRVRGEQLRKACHFGQRAPFYYVCGMVLFLVLIGLLGCVWTCLDRRIRSNLAEPCRDVCLCCCHPWVCGDCYMCMWLDCTSCCESSMASCAECCTAAGGLGEVGAAFFLVLALLAVLCLAVFGLFYSLLVATMMGQRIWQRHNHILAKRMLTKEYVVEDLDGESLPPDWGPPPLPPDHAQQLKDLGLL